MLMSTTKERLLRLKWRVKTVGLTELKASGDESSVCDIVYHSETIVNEAGIIHKSINGLNKKWKAEHLDD